MYNELFLCRTTLGKTDLSILQNLNVLSKFVNTKRIFAVSLLQHTFLYLTYNQQPQPYSFLCTE